MMLREGQVEAVHDFKGSQELTVTITACPDNAEQFFIGQKVQVLSYPQLIGKILCGDRVRFDCSPLQRNLGTKTADSSRNGFN